jgi:hypothetical protein
MESFYQIPSMSIFCGKPNSGKSTTMKYIAQKFFSLNKWHYVIVICSELTRKAYDWIPEEYVYTFYCPEVIYKLLLQQNKYKKTVGEVHCLLIFDDIGGYADEFKKPLIKKLFTEHRHANISVFISLQYMSLIHSYTTSICNYGWIYALESQQDYEGCFKAFGRRYICPDKKDKSISKRATLGQFIDFIQNNTKNHNIIVCDREDKNNPYKFVNHPLPDKDFKITL